MLLSSVILLEANLLKTIRKSKFDIGLIEEKFPFMFSQLFGGYGDFNRYVLASKNNNSDKTLFGWLEDNVGPGYIFDQTFETDTRNETYAINSKGRWIATASFGIIAFRYETGALRYKLSLL